MSSPFEYELAGNVFHVVKHGADAERTKSRHQNSMRELPIVFARVGGEEAIMLNSISILSMIQNATTYRSITNLLKCSGDTLVESLLVANFIQECDTRDDDSLFAKNVETVDGP